MSRDDDDRPLLAAVTLNPDATLLGLELPLRAGPRVGSVVVIAGAAADVGIHLRVDPEVVIGRADVQLVLRDGRISRRHARVYREGDDWWIEDLGSTNGTALQQPGDAAPTKLPGRALLQDGARICVGSTVVKFAWVDETEARYLEQISRLAATDPLTGLHAPHRFDSLLEEAVRVAGVTGTSLAVLMLDLDGVKQVNDRHGHRFGAHAIATVGRGLLERVREVGEATRYGGDEFAVVLPGADVARARAFAEGFRRWVEQGEISLDGVPIGVTVSVGVAAAVAPTRASALTDEADAALYRAKAAGKNLVSE
ncbi:MAG: GGDEF domain-containing protein [Myxococcota bacterium]